MREDVILTMEDVNATLDFLRDNGVHGVGMLPRCIIKEPVDAFTAALRFFYTATEYDGAVPDRFCDVRFSHSGLKCYEIERDDAHDPAEWQNMFNASILNGLVAVIAFPFQRRLGKRWLQYHKEQLVLQCKLQTKVCQLLDSLFECVDAAPRCEKEEK